MKRDIDKIVEQTINSFDGSRRAEGKPFLLTRIYARMQNKTNQNVWTKAGSFLSRPVVALGGLALIIALNAVIILRGTGSSSDENGIMQNVSNTKDDFAINVISIYDTENQ